MRNREKPHSYFQSLESHLAVLLVTTFALGGKTKQTEEKLPRAAARWQGKS